MKRINYPSASEWPLLLQRPTFDSSSLNDVVGEVLRNVRTRGDEAVREYGLKFDKVVLTELEVSLMEIAESENSISSDLKEAINLSCANITAFHRAQDTFLPIVETMPGVTCWQKQCPSRRSVFIFPAERLPCFLPS